jgi:hypothetical protein
MFIATLVIVGWVAAYLSLREAQKRRCEDLRREFLAQLNMLYARTWLLDRSAVAGPPAEPVAEIAGPEETGLRAEMLTKPMAWPAPAKAPGAPEEVSPETMAVLAETVSGFLGKKVRIRSARKIPMPPPQRAHPPSDGADAWAQQGRVLVQGSHESVHARTFGPTAQPAPHSFERSGP